MSNPRLVSIGASEVFYDPATGEYMVDLPDSVVGEDDSEFAGNRRRPPRREGRRDDRQDDRQDDRGDHRSSGSGYAAAPPPVRRAPPPAAPPLARVNMAAQAPGPVQGSGSGNGSAPSGWVNTAVGSSAKGPAGAVSVKIRLQHDFLAQDIIVTGAPAGSKINAIFFGDQPVWAIPEGVDISVFGTGSQMRQFLAGATIRGGLDIVITGTLAAEGEMSITLTGSKPARSTC